MRPLRQEMKCGEFDLYRATYCGLCRCLRRRCGLLAPMFLNFDFTFLTLLLWQPEAGFQPCRGRCHANPLLKKDADITLSAEERQIGGLGILMVKRSMDQVDYIYKDGYNILSLVKEI